LFNSLYAKTEYLDRLVDRFDEFSSIENINELLLVMIPTVERFLYYITVLIASNEEVKECVRKFDEDISMKANYSQL